MADRLRKDRSLPVPMSSPSPLLKLPQTRAERWRLLSQFIGDWYRPLKAGDGYTRAGLRSRAASLAIPFPAALGEWYEIAGRRDDVWRLQDTLLSPDCFFCEDGVLHFCVENQGVTSWGIRIADLSLEDPPVVVRDERENWVIQRPELSAFVLHLAAFGVQFGADIPHIHGYAHPPALERIVSRLPMLGFPEFVWTRTRLCGFCGLIVAIDGTDHVTASGWRPKSLAPFRDLICGADFQILHEVPDPNGDGR